MKLNNVNLDNLKQFEEEINKNPAKAKTTQVITGEWNPADSKVQFKSDIQYEKGSAVFEVDNPSFMGGEGNLPGPMHYCFYGLASCYTGVFATMASMLGLEIKKLTARVEADVNFTKVFGLADQPIMEEVSVSLDVVSDASEEDLKKAEELALQRCPVVYTLKNPVNFKPELKISNE